MTLKLVSKTRLQNFIPVETYKKTIKILKSLSDQILIKLYEQISVQELQVRKSR